MKVLTESILRSELRNSSLLEYEVEDGMIVTPSAKQYLNDKKIKLIYKKDKLSKIQSSNNRDTKEKAGDNAKVFTPKYVDLNGGSFDKKPEYMTQLRGNKLVSKDNKRIMLRGKLDSLQSKILEVQILSKNSNENNLLKELEEVLAFVRKVLASEVLEQEFSFDKLIGLNNDELRAYSHNPKKYLDTEHIIFPNVEMGPMVVYLNSLRAQSREVEISAYKAFKDQEGKPTRPDITMALNRLSSCFYIMMCKYAANKYK